MKRTPFKKKGGFLKKKTKLKRKSKSENRRLQDEIWEHCRRIVFERDSVDGEVDCYTCPAKALQGSNRQLGHVPWPKATLGAFLKYDLRLLKYQCFRCNINFSGMGGVAYPKMELENGKEFMQQLEKDRQITVQATNFYLTLKERYASM